MNDEIIYNKIRKFISADRFIISNHARIRMFQRNVTTDHIKEILMNGEIIEEYPNDYPCPSVLILGFIKEVPFHIVTALCKDHLRIITVYQPDKQRWDYFRKRKE